MRRPRFFSKQIPSALSHVMRPGFPILRNHTNLAHVLLKFGGRGLPLPAFRSALAGPRMPNV